jgi:hypothetical protein
MTTPLATVGTRLHGRTIFLAASVPTPRRHERYRRIEGAAFEIEQAVISLARAIFSEGGHLVFGGHPAISPLVAMVAGEYREPRHTETQEERPPSPISVFQSRAFQGFLPEETLMMYQLGYATITWIDAAAQERFDPTRDEPEGPCPKSLRKMRVAMIHTTRPDAMVCIGGMNGVEEELALLGDLQPGTPVYVLGRTGGAAALIAEQYRKKVRVIDDEVMERIATLRHDHPRIDEKDRDRREESGPPVVPYPLIAQTIVDELAHNQGTKRL